MREDFSAFDKNSDMKITKDEAKVELAERNPDNDLASEDMFKFMDLNHDDEITLDEFYEAFMQPPSEEDEKYEVGAHDENSEHDEDDEHEEHDEHDEL